MSDTDHEVLATLLRLSAHLEGIQSLLQGFSERLDCLERIEELFRDLVEQNDEAERRWQRMLAALSLAAGNHAAHHDC